MPSCSLHGDEDVFSPNSADDFFKIISLVSFMVSQKMF